MPPPPTTAMASADAQRRVGPSGPIEGGESRPDADPYAGQVIGVCTFPFRAVVKPAGNLLIYPVQHIVDGVRVEQGLRIRPKLDRVNELTDGRIAIDVGSAVDVDGILRNTEAEVAAPRVLVEGPVAGVVGDDPVDGRDRHVVI